MLIDFFSWLVQSILEGGPTRRPTQPSAPLAADGLFECALRVIQGGQIGLDGEAWRRGFAYATAGCIRMDHDVFPILSVDIYASRPLTVWDSFSLPAGARVYPVVAPTAQLELAIAPRHVSALIEGLTRREPPAPAT